MHPSPTRAQVYQVNDPCYEIGGGAPQIGIKVKDPMWYLKSNTSNVIPTMWCCPSKMKIQVSNIYPNASLCINEKHIFYGN
jgi:hypothetical protein